jgi:hypothetical protein
MWRMRIWCCWLLCLLVLLAGCVSTAPAPEPDTACAIAAHPAGDVEPTEPGILLYDDFSDQAASAFRASSSEHVQYAFDSGAYRIGVHVPSLLAWSMIEDERYSDGSIQVAATLAAGAASSASGLVFRYQDADNFYMFNVAYNGFYSLERFSDGEQVVLIDWTPSAAIERISAAASAVPNAPVRRQAGVQNVLRVDMQGEHITLLVNDVPLETTTDSMLREGGVALAVNTFERGETVVCFDTLIIRTI